MKNKISEIIAATIAIIIVLGVIYTTSPTLQAYVNKTIRGKPFVRVDNERLIIDDFEYSYGTVGINELSGDFDKLNEKIYNVLKNRQGDFKVILITDETDKYGNKMLKEHIMGTISASELNKYTSIEKWKKSVGIETLFLPKISKQNSSSTYNSESNTNITNTPANNTSLLENQSTINDNDLPATEFKPDFILKFNDTNNIDQVRLCKLVATDTDPIGVKTFYSKSTNELFRLIVQGETTYIIEFYKGSTLQVTLELIERPDLENTKSTGVYRSKDDQTTITIMKIG